jgi:NADPH:quinone reductase-like Zn-dependent oxidoreductase
MKIAQFKEFGKPEEVLEVVEQDVEFPVANEVLISIEAAPIHIADLKFMSGTLTFGRTLPATPGVEAVGRVVQVGSGVKQFQSGARVFIPLRISGNGAWRQQVKLKENDITSAPEGDPIQLCLAPINALTSIMLLRGVVKFNPGDWLIQNAANSNCGRFLISLAHRDGNRTVNIVRRDSLIPELKDLGANIVLVDGDDLALQVRKATNNAPIKLAIDAVAGKATQRLADCVSYGATILAYGLLSGEPCAVNPETMFQKHLSLRGFLTTNFMEEMSKAEVTRLQNEVPALIADGTLTAKIAATYTLDQIRDAVRHAAKTGKDRDGKIIILPNG